MENFNQNQPNFRLQKSEKVGTHQTQFHSLTLLVIASNLLHKIFQKYSNTV